MTDPPRYPDFKPHTTPRWVKVFGIIAAVVILAFVFKLVTEGPHRPGMNMQGSGGDNAPSSNVTAPGAGGGHNPFDRGN